MEISANELRIGNWVLYQGQFKIVRYIQIDRIGSIKKNLQPQTILLSKCHGIPLTEEILLKCGFEYSEPFPNIRCILIKDNFEIGLDGDDFSLNQMSVRINKAIIIKVKYLHQLQNLYFALTGQELEINL